MWIDAPQPLQAPDERNDAYRRQARRVRHRFQHDPARMQQALSHAARIHDQAHALATPSAPAAGVDLPLPQHMVGDPSVARAFALAVAAALDEGVLRYSQRMKLIQEAARHGIGRFEANLIIAAIQHQYGTPPAPRQRPRRIFRPPAILLALAAETLLILWLCWLMG